MTVVAEAAPAVVSITTEADGAPARWPSRATAFLVDVLPGTGVVATAVVVSVTVPRYSPWWFVAVSVAAVAILATALNRTIVPGLTGFSLGRALVGIRVMTRGGDLPAPGRLLVRDLAHLLDTAAALVGWLWPLWDRRHRTFADLLLGTEVRDARPRSSAATLRDRTAAVLLGAALVSVALAGMSNLAVYRPGQIDQQVRAELALQGPKAVADMLSFHPKTLADDFAHAQTLVTDHYRAELVTVQEQIAKTATPHEYWVPDSAVLSATQDRATMLMFLQGQTGSTPKIQPISVTVRVGLVRSGSRWLVDELAFVPPPKKPEAGR